MEISTFGCFIIQVLILIPGHCCKMAQRHYDLQSALKDLVAGQVNF